MNDLEPVGSLSPLLQIAMSKEFDADKLGRMLEVQRQWEKAEALKAYHRAITAFKAAAPKVEKNRQVSFGGGKTAYHHTTLAYALNKITPFLSKEGLTLSWQTDQEGGLIKVTAVLTHILGHSESTSLSASPDSSGSKNSIQALGSTVSYLERYTAFSLLGLASSDQDDDANSAEVICAEQKEELLSLIADTGYADLNKLAGAICAEQKVSSLEQIQARNFDSVVTKLKMMTLERKNKVVAGKALAHAGRA